MAALTAVALAGCGEIKNTINPQPGTANNVTVALAGQPNAFYIGLYEAEAQGYFKQSDMNVHVVVPAAGQDPVTMVHDGQALIGISSEPSVLLHRNEDQPVVGVAALVHAPLSAITIPVPKARSVGWGDADHRHDDHGHDNDDHAHQGEAAQAAHQAHDHARTRPPRPPPRRPRRAPRRRQRPPPRRSPSPTRRCGPNSCSSC